MIFEGHRDEVDRYLHAVDEIQRSMSSASLSDDDHHSKLSSAIQIAMARLEDEFRNILLNHTSPIEPDSLSSSDPSSSRFSSASNADDFDPDDASSTPKASDDDLLRRGDSSNAYRSTTSIRELDLIPSDAVVDLRKELKKS